MTGPTIVDGTTQPGYAGTPIIEIANLAGSGLKLQGGSSTIRGILVRGLNTGIALESSNNHVEGCYVGTDVTGTVAAATATAPASSSSPAPRATRSAAPRRPSETSISGNITGIALINATDSVIQGNSIGTTADGAAALGNSRGHPRDRHDRTSSSADRAPGKGT